MLRLKALRHYFIIVKPAKETGFRSLAGEWAPLVAGFRTQIRSRFPELGKEFLIKRRAQVANSFGAAGASFGAHHSLDHLDVMRAPQRKPFVVVEQGFSQRKLLFVLFKVGQNIAYGAHPFAVGAAPLFFREWRIVGGRIETTPPQQRIENIAQRRLLHSLLQTTMSKFV